MLEQCKLAARITFESTTMEVGIKGTMLHWQLPHWLPVPTTAAPAPFLIPVSQEGSVMDALNSWPHTA